MAESSIEDRIGAVFGAPVSDPAGVLHVAAVARADDGGRRVIRIGEGAPRSETDAFLLGLSRARSDAIVTTGAILRAERDLEHRLDANLGTWRARVLGKGAPPTVVVLTRGEDLDLAHPALASSPALIATGARAAARLASDASRRGIEVAGLDDPSPRGVLRVLAHRGWRDVCIEAGPSTSSALYEEPALVDELVLSTFEEGALPPALDAGRFVAADRLRTLFGAAVSEVERTEESGRWRFSRFRRG